MDSATRAELASLRSRAYGPSADIDRDPDARRRLGELEDLSRGPAPSSELDSDSGDPGSAPAIAPLPHPGPTVEGDAGPTAPIMEDAEQQPSPDADPVAARNQRNPRRLPRRYGLLWGGSVVATAAIAAAVTYGVVRVAPVTAFDGARQIATLEPDTTLQIPAGWFGAGASSASYEFYGLTLFETSNGYYGPGGDCLYIVLSTDIPTDQNAGQGSWSTTGPVYSGCRVGRFPATVAIPVNSDAPAELRAQYPDGSLQFIKDGDRVGVFLDDGSTG